MSGHRPEHVAPPEIFYSTDEAVKYTTNSRMIEIQVQMSERAIELLMLPEDESCLILDIGCGSGLSGKALEEQGHNWIGVDISQAMLDVAVEREVEGDLVLGDMGQGMCFRAGTFDGAISISALQWLCNADKKSHKPAARLSKFFTSLYGCLSRGSRAVFQFYPENSAQIELVTQQAMKAGFSGGLVVDFPNSTRAKKTYVLLDIEVNEGTGTSCIMFSKGIQQLSLGVGHINVLEGLQRHFLVLMTGGYQKLPAALGTEESADHVKYVKSRIRNKIKRGKSVKNGRDWILEKKERRRRQGKEVPSDSKYTARKRSSKF